jgi:hypothetical protein
VLVTSVVYTALAVVVISAISNLAIRASIGTLHKKNTPGIDETCVVAGNAPSEVVETPVVYTVFDVVFVLAISPAVEVCTEFDNRSTPVIDETCVVAGNTSSEV